VPMIGLDATPVRDDGRGMAEVFDAIECCVDNKTLVKEGHLVPVRCYAPQDKSATKRSVSGDPVTAWKALAAGRPTVVFCSRIAESLAVCQRYNDAGIKAEHIDGTTPDAVRDAVLRRVASGQTMVVCSVGTMTEGVDVPILSCAQLLCPCHGYAGYIQKIGRIRRPHPGKKDAVVLDHADAVLEHGVPDDPVSWELTYGAGTVEAKNKKDRDEGVRSTPCACQECGAIFDVSKGAVCPECGHRLPPRKVPPKIRARILTEVDASLNDAERLERRRKYWVDCLRVMAHKGQTFGAAAGMYRRRYAAGPEPDFPGYPKPFQWKTRVADVLPHYLQSRKRGSA
jgi:DNA repair protein RadD